NPRGQGILGFCFGEGFGDESTAVGWYSAAAAQNHARAQDKLGVCLQLGIGCEKDEESALHYFRLAAEQDHLAAMFHLANALEKGIGCEADPEDAIHWFEKAASAGCRISCDRLKRLLVRECLGHDSSGSIYLSGCYAAAA
ncbi:16629_t:CDS:2, partial [Acaulospora morrowiae]